MKKYFLLFFIPFLTFAQVGGELVVGETTVTYDRVRETDDSTLYFTDEYMIASQADGITIVYDQYGKIVIEAHDTDGDSTLDAFVTLDKYEQIDTVTGPGAAAFVRPTTTLFADLRTTADNAASQVATEDLVGDLDTITIPGYVNWKLYVFILLLAGGGYWWYRKKSNGDKVTK